MTGITSIGAYIPRYRLSIEELAKFWHVKGTGGDKAVAGYDEDTITMAFAAASDCLSRSDKPDALYLATTTNPYREKQGAAIIASALDLNKENCTADFTNSLRSASIAMRAALNAVKSGSSRNVIVIASDSRLGAAARTIGAAFGRCRCGHRDRIGSSYCGNRGMPFRF